MGPSSGVITPAVSGSLRPGLGCHDAVDHSSQQYRQRRRGNLGEDVTPKVQYTHDGSEGARHANAVLLSDLSIGEGDTQPVLEIAVLGHMAFPVQLRYGGPVALVENKQGVMFENLVDEPVQSEEHTSELQSL